MQTASIWKSSTIIQNIARAALAASPDVQPVEDGAKRQCLAQAIWDDICKETAAGGPRTSVEIILSHLPVESQDEQNDQGNEGQSILET